MSRDGKVQMEAVVLEAHGNAMFRVRLTESGHEALCHVGGKMRSRSVNVVPGDTVVVELSPYDLDRGRIVFRKRTVDR